jgi:hypothetical protein
MDIYISYLAGNKKRMDIKKSDMQVLIIIHTQNFILIYFFINFYLLYFVALCFVLINFLLPFFFPNFIPRCFVIENFTSLTFLVYLQQGFKY